MCTLWHLPCIPDTYGPSIERLFKLDRHTLSNIPDLCIPDAFKTWASDGKRVLFVTDNKTLAELINGRSDLIDISYRPAFLRIARALAMAFRAGWKPPQDVQDYCHWIPRKYNTTADHLENIALDSRSCWQDDLQSFNGDLDSVLVYSDGGFHHESRSSSAGVAVFRVKRNPFSVTCIFRQYKFWSSGRSPFESEVVAMETAVQTFVDAICSTTLAHKRRRL